MTISNEKIKNDEKENQGRLEDIVNKSEIVLLRTECGEIIRAIYKGITTITIPNTHFPVNKAAFLYPCEFNIRGKKFVVKKEFIPLAELKFYDDGSIGDLSNKHVFKGYTENSREYEELKGILK